MHGHKNIKLPRTLTHELHVSKTYELPEGGQQLRPEHVQAFINK